MKTWGVIKKSVGSKFVCDYTQYVSLLGSFLFIDRTFSLISCSWLSFHLHRWICTIASCLTFSRICATPSTTAWYYGDQTTSIWTCTVMRRCVIRLTENRLPVQLSSLVAHSSASRYANLTWWPYLQINPKSSLLLRQWKSCFSSSQSSVHSHINCLPSFWLPPTTQNILPVLCLHSSLTTPATFRSSTGFSKLKKYLEVRNAALVNYAKKKYFVVKHVESSKNPDGWLTKNLRFFTL